MAEEQKGAMSLNMHKAYINSKVWRAGQSDKSPYCAYIKWFTKGREKSDTNTIMLKFFANNSNHPFITASKGDIVKFDNGLLKFSSKKEGKTEVIQTAEILVFNNLTVEKVMDTTTNNYNQQPQQEIQQQSQQAQEKSDVF